MQIQFLALIDKLMCVEFRIVVRPEFMLHYADITQDKQTVISVHLGYM